MSIGGWVLLLSDRWECGAPTTTRDHVVETDVPGDVFMSIDSGDTEGSSCNGDGTGAVATGSVEGNGAGGDAGAGNDDTVPFFG